MTATPKSAWKTKELAQTFLKDVRGAIPGADLQLAVIGKIVQQWSANPKRFLDLGCGDGILGRLLFQIFPDASGLLVDFSDPMLGAAQEQVGTLPNATLIQADFSRPQWLEAVPPGEPFDVIVSGFAIHHQPDKRKKALYAEIYDLLAPGGVFLNLEHVASVTNEGEILFDEFFIDHLHAFHRKSDPGADRDTIANAYYKRPDKEENRLVTLAAQCCWLEDIGFVDVDCFFKCFELALFGGRKISDTGASADALASCG